MRTFSIPTQTGKPRKMGRHFPVREMSGNFEQTGKPRKMRRHFPVREMSGNFEQTGKPRKMRRHFPVRKMSGNFEQTGKVICKILENSGNFRQLLLVNFSDI